MLSGKWTYRSYHNDPALVGSDAQAALAMIFGEGVFDLADRDGAITGTLDMGGGYVLDLNGNATGEGAFLIIGLGRAGTPTEGWRYDYNGGPGWDWPNGIEQVPSLLGTVIRVNQHGPQSPAGVTCSFIAIGQPST